MASFRDFVPPILLRGSRSKAIDLDSGIGAWLVPQGEAEYATGRSFQQTVNKGYAMSPYLFRGVRMISQSVAGIPWLLYQDRQAKSKGDTLDSHPSLVLLNVRANKNEMAGVFWQYVVSYMLLAGDCFIYAVRPSPTRPPVELYALRPDWVTPKMDPNTGEMVSYEYGPYQEAKQQIALEDVLRVPEINPLRTAAGIAPAKVAGRAVDQLTAADDWNTALMQNMARPSGLLSPDPQVGGTGTLTVEQQDRLKQMLQERYQGPKNAGKPLVPSAAMKWTQMGSTPTEMDWLNGKLQAMRQTAIAIGVPPQLLGDAAASTYHNYGEAKASLYTETIFPMMDIIAGGLSMWLAPMYGLDPVRYTYDYDRDSVEALQEDRGQVWDRANTSTFLTINEKREMLGYDSIGSDGDVILVLNTMIPLEEATEPPQPVPAPLTSIPGGKPAPGAQKPDPNATNSVAVDDQQKKPAAATGTDGKSVVPPFASSRARQPGSLRNPGATRSSTHTSRR